MENQENVLVVIPEEVKQLSMQVKSDKRDEIEKILSQVFIGVNNWVKQIDSIVVKDHTDTLAMNMAATARKTVKKARTDMESMFDTKRDFVQAEKAEFDLEDKLYLRSKQIAVALFKDAEQRAAFKEDTLKRYEIEQKEVRTQERLQKVIIFNPTVSRFDVENLSDEMFNIFLAGIEKEYNDRIDAELKAEQELIENERLLKLLSERRFTLAKFGGFYNQTKEISIETTEEEFNVMVLDCEKVKKEYEVQQEKQRLENERLKLEAEAKQKEIDAANLKAENERKAAALQLAHEQEAARLEAVKIAKANEAMELELKKQLQEKEQERMKLELAAELKRKAEFEAETAKLQAEEKSKKESEKLAKAPVKKQLDVWANSFSIQDAPIENEISKLITEKFEAFKNWSLQQIETL